MIYFDNSATTRTFDECAAIATRYATENYYNPSALYLPSLDVTRDLRAARMTIASVLGADADEIVFTASGTESDNTVIFGAKRRKNCNIVITAMEHAAVFHAAMHLESQGVELRIAPVDCTGRVREDELLAMIDDRTTLVSVIHVSNETGAVNDIVSLARHAKQKNPNLLFHSDGVQAFVKQPVRLKGSMIDAYSVSAHKIGGMKGVGALYIKQGVHLNPLLRGGGQENGFRPSTENVPAIMAMAEAVKIFSADRDFGARVSNFKNTICNYIVESMPNVIINSGTANTVDYILSLAFPKINGETLLHVLEKQGILVGVGSACSSKSKEKRIAAALGLPKDYENGIIRISFGIHNTLDEVYALLSILKTSLESI